MTSYLKNVAIIGASGSIGNIILDGLAASSRFEITVISRKDSEATFPPDMTVLKTDYSEECLESAFKGKDVVISAVGASAFGEQKKFVDAAIRTGVKRFIPSEFSANSQNEVVLQLLPLFEQKKELVEYLKSKETHGLTWTGIASSGLFDWGLANGFLEFDIARHTATIWDGGNKSFTLTNQKALGEAVVSLLLHPHETRNQFLFIASIETTQKDILAALEKESGVKWTVNETTTNIQVNEAVNKLAAGDFNGAFALVRATVFGNIAGLHSNYAKEEKLANNVLGLHLETVSDVVKRVFKE
ncbi:hypothetical protein N7491_010599 [Penicillium cf. griseofulvum]|uniref:NmrA-like domain-containing protein n=1 Tax=Penicillium cf. griseofulvum TaxID=2972120 RepID=A0A9W9N0Z6_9EURO|nr:hypothetical protein N7472_000928 [Penicillium cf. griseofulvum]KAJ5422154.1 hypothetical protein N7491_010599 [Penicillium cf. griseofulvum]KAJ5428339.1 hypothetical protein N7445_009793 [Penicillium cf. griseofulvum]